MRRSDREVKAFDDIIDILRRADTMRLGLNGGEYPYVVPLSFGFSAADGKITVYFHGAKEGMKHDILANNNKVCVEASIFHRFAEVAEHRSLTTEYESFIGFGTAKTVSGVEALKGLDLICAHAGYDGFDYGGENALGTVRVYKIEIESFTAKRRLI